MWIHFRFSQDGCFDLYSEVSELPGSFYSLLQEQCGQVTASQHVQYNIHITKLNYVLIRVSLWLAMNIYVYSIRNILYDSAAEKATGYGLLCTVVILKYNNFKLNS